MLIRLISTVRQKPKHIRDQYAFWIAIGCTVLIGVVWLSGLTERVVTDSQTANDAESSGVFSGFVSEITGQFSEVADNISQQSSTTIEIDTSVQSDQIDMQAALDAEPAQESPATRTVRIATTTASTTQ